MSTSTNSKAAVGRYIGAVESGDERRIRECFTEDASWQLRGELPISGTWEGQDAIVDEFLAAALRYYAPGSVSLEVTGIVAEGDQVVMEWTSRARNRRGEPYENFCIGVFTVRDGKIQAVREYMDTLYAHRTAFAS
jgi:ketosteroid isomerase-like protein